MMLRKQKWRGIHLPQYGKHAFSRGFRAAHAIRVILRPRHWRVNNTHSIGGLCGILRECGACAELLGGGGGIVAHPPTRGDTPEMLFFGNGLCFLGPRITAPRPWRHPVASPPPARP